MPAKQDYLSTPGQRALKITAGIIGGFILAMAIQLVFGAAIEHKGALLMTSACSTFFLWVLFMILAFLFKNGWKAWGVYLLGTGFCAVLIYILL